MSKLCNIFQVDEIKNVFNVWFKAVGVLLKRFMILQNLYFIAINGKSIYLAQNTIKQDIVENRFIQTTPQAMLSYFLNFPKLTFNFDTNVYETEFWLTDIELQLFQSFNFL